MTAAVKPSRYFIKEPIPAIFEACELLSAAAEAHLNGDREIADALFRQADMREIWNWINPDWEKPHLNVRDHQPQVDTQEVPKTMRYPLRHPSLHVKAAVLVRDGHRCRYCGIPVIHADVRKIAHELYPDAVPWEWRDPRKQHAAFQCFWLQYDHVVPHSHGGSSAEECHQLRPVQLRQGQVHVETAWPMRSASAAADAGPLEWSRMLEGVRAAAIKAT
ncbi:HNH endonuclease [Sinorhizobium meliloti]|uniref:HNH endonuclease n=1 Tax=Rhizobium meliloti TaxID=382 RepID=UPI00398CBD5F